MSQVNSKNPAVIISDLEYKHGLDPGTLAGRKISKFVSQIRKLAIIQLRALGCSYPDIGLYLGKRHHTSVLKLIQERVPVDNSVDNSVDKVGKGRGKRVSSVGIKNRKKIV